MESRMFFYVDVEGKSWLLKHDEVLYAQKLGFVFFWCLRTLPKSSCHTLWGSVFGPAFRPNLRGCESGSFDTPTYWQGMTGRLGGIGIPWDSCKQPFFRENMFGANPSTLFCRCMYQCSMGLEYLPMFGLDLWYTQVNIAYVDPMGIVAVKKSDLLNKSNLTTPIPSMYGIFTYMWLIFMVNVGKYTIPMDPMGYV